MAEATKLKTDFEDEIDDDEAVEEAEPMPGKDLDGVPYCRIHHCRMKQTSGGAKGSPTSYFKCPVPKCDCTAQMIKTKRESVVPRDPVICSRCSTARKPVVCERSDQFSTSVSVVLQCPNCSWKSNAMAIPQFASQAYAARRRANNHGNGIGDR